MPRLTMQRKIIAVGADYSVKREDGEIAYRVDGKLRFASTFSIDDRDGREVARGREKLLTLDTLVELHRDGAPLANVRKARAGGRDRFVVEFPDGSKLEARGFFHEDDYKLTRGGLTVAVVKQVRYKLREIYEIEVSPGEDEVMVLAVVTAIVRLVPEPRTGEP